MAKQAAQLKKQSQALKSSKDTSVAAMQKKAQQAVALKQEAAKLKQTQAQLAPAMKRAKASVEDQLLPKKPQTGIHNLISTNKMVLRANLNGDKVLGIAMMVPGAKVAMGSSLTKDKSTLQQEAEQLEKQKKAASQKEDFERAAKLRDKLDQVQDQINNIDSGTKVATPKVTPEIIQSVVERITGVPVTDVNKNEVNQLNHLDTDLKKEVIGQDKALEAISAAVRRSRVGFTEGNRPIGSFLFVGPTGVGKTQTAKALAKELFGTTKAMFRYDMSEYMDKISASKLIGSAPGRLRIPAHTPTAHSRLIKWERGRVKVTNGFTSRIPQTPIRLRTAGFYTAAWSRLKLRGWVWRGYLTKGHNPNESKGHNPNQLPEDN